MLDDEPEIKVLIQDELKKVHWYENFNNLKCNSDWDPTAVNIYGL